MSSLAKSPRDKTKVNVAWVGGGIPEAGEAGEAGEFFTSTLLTFFGLDSFRTFGGWTWPQTRAPSFLSLFLMDLQLPFLP